MPHRLKTYLASNQELRRLSGQAQQLAVLQRCYEGVVPPALQRVSRVTQLRQQLVIISADSGAVAAKLRQMSSDLISLFQARGCEVSGIQIRVQVSIPRPAGNAGPRRLGGKARTALERLENELEESPLKTALRRLARRP